VTDSSPKYPPRFDPESLPSLGADDHLPAVPSTSIDPAAMRRRFVAPPTWQPEIKVERRFVEREDTHASVLVPLVLRDEMTVLLTQRTDHLNDHPGQISFPGGRAEASDPDPVATALREAHEEIGLEPFEVEVLGSLPTYTTSTGFIVTPVIGLVQPRAALRPDPFEVAELFEVPLAWLMIPRTTSAMRSSSPARRASSSRSPGRAATPMARRGGTSSGARPRRCCATSIGSSLRDAVHRRAAEAVRARSAAMIGRA
jgi:8-oxo-dGTP pyrophosphatase MutT (NUDIX family)